MKTTSILILTALSLAGLSSCAGTGSHQAVYSHNQLPKNTLQARNHAVGNGSQYHLGQVAPEHVLHVPYGPGGKHIAGL